MIKLIGPMMSVQCLLARAMPFKQHLMGLMILSQASAEEEEAEPAGPSILPSNVQPHTVQTRHVQHSPQQYVAWRVSWHRLWPHCLHSKSAPAKVTSLKFLHTPARSCTTCGSSSKGFRQKQHCHATFRRIKHVRMHQEALVPWKQNCVLLVSAVLPQRPGPCSCTLICFAILRTLPVEPAQTSHTAGRSEPNIASISAASLGCGHVGWTGGGRASRAAGTGRGERGRAIRTPARAGHQPHLLLSS